MKRLSVIVIAIVAVAVTVTAQELTNHAAGRPYRVNVAPVGSYGDDGGPEAFAAGQFYRGELTDGATGPANYRAAEWVGWRDTDYREPISVEIDLGEPRWIDRIELNVCSGGGNVEPPPRIDVAIVSPRFPYDSYVQVAQILAPEDREPDGAQIVPFTLEEAGFEASRVRLDFHEPTWSYLFVDEIRLLGGEPGEAGILPLQDILMEAEAGTTTGEAVEVDGATETAVLLDERGESLSFEMPLPAGDYTVRVRSLALAPDTFSELELHAGDARMRPQAITNNIFTWQRSHFTQPEDGPATITMTLEEGAGVYLDQVRVHRLRLNESIVQLRRFKQDTQLAEGGELNAIIAIGDEGQYRASAEELAATIERRTGERPAIIEGDAVDEEHFQTTHVIALGDASVNFAIVKSSPNTWGAIPGPPEEGEAQIFVDVEPRGTGVNTVVLGGRDESQVRRSVDAFTERLQGDADLTLPWVQLPAPEYEDSREHYREMAIESSKWLRQGAIRHLHRDWKYYPDDTFVLLGYRYLEYLDSPDTIRQVPSDGFIDAETQKIVGSWDRREHHPSFTDLERLQLTNLILLMARKCVGIFDWNCVRLPGGEKRHHSPEEITQILQQRPETIAHNHQTFPTYAITTAGGYFSKYYDLPEAEDWLRWAELFMQGPLKSSKPMEDCWGYMDITSTHVSRYAAVTGRWDWFERRMLYDYLTLRLMSHDSMGSPAGYGDVGAYQVPNDGLPTPEENAGSRFLPPTGGRIDLSRADWDGHVGLYVHPMEPMYYDYYAEDQSPPLEETFDKLSYRAALDARASYLLLDGISGGYHGHWDGNSILRFTDNGRMWLCEGDYLKSEPKDHNTLTIMRNAESATPQLFSSLEAEVESDQWCSTITRTAGYNGLDWDRHLIWHRASDTFVVLDEVQALEPGSYDVKARFRSLGQTSLEDHLWHVEQQGEHFFLHAPGAGSLAEAIDPEDTDNWANYEFAEDTTPKILSHRMRKELRPGQRMVLPAVFYAQSQPQPRIDARRLGNAIVTDGAVRLIAGAGDLDSDALTVRARQFALTPEGVLMTEGTLLSAGGEALVEADAPVTLTLDLAQGTGAVEAAAEATLTVHGAEGMQTIEVPTGRSEIGGDFSSLAGALGGAWQGAWEIAEAAPAPPAPEPTRNMRAAFEVQMPAEVLVLRAADITGDGTMEYLAGCADGTLVALDPAGNELWRHGFDARVNDLDVGQIEIGGPPEIAVGVEDSHLHVLTADGEELWARFFEAYTAAGGIEGHPRAVLIDDFEGDGVNEIAVGSANSFFYVLDNTGELKNADGEPWETVWRHKGLAIGAVDLTGDGLKELLCGYTYFSQRIMDFSRSGSDRLTVVSSAKGGNSVIAVADVDGDDLPEALWGDVDGQITACTVASGDDRMADVNWVRHIGDDRVAALVPADVDGDGAPEIALASHSGFLALLEAEDGTVQWVRYAGNQVTDAAIIDGAIARTSRDGSVAIFDAAGNELARWHVGDPLQMLAVAPRDGERPLVVAAGGDTVRGAIWDR